ncbi:MAG: TonB C-terminal domain-containing protein, partial [Acidobacteriota bacterium]|nr:TonB C-terminal domain-containing protein [Acidobacteriota bacterium]
ALNHAPIPPVQSPALALPSAPRPAAPLVDAPSAHIAQNSPPAHDSMQDLIQGAHTGRPGEYGPGARPSSAGPLQAGAHILSDTMGVDFTAYMRRLHDDIQRNWDPLIPEEVRPPLLKKGAVGIRFTILPGGEIGNMVLESRSGDVALDHAAWNAITSEGNFPPLPREFHGPQLELRIGFFYNEAVQ